MSLARKLSTQWCRSSPGIRSTVFRSYLWLPCYHSSGVRKCSGSGASRGGDSPGPQQDVSSAGNSSGGGGSSGAANASPGGAKRTAAGAAAAAAAGSSSGSGGVDPRETVVRVVPKISKTKRIDLSESYTANIYITPLRAMHDYLLSSSELEGLWTTKRRSPYDDSPPITVYLRHAVEQRAKEKWGSLEQIEQEKHRLKEAEEFRLGGMLRGGHDQVSAEVPFLFGPNAAAEAAEPHVHRNEAMLEGKRKTIFKSGSGRVVLYAILINGTNAALKFIAWLYSGSHSMFAEAVHSLADTINQVILAYGISHSLKNPDARHPYGYTGFRYVASLISGVGVFCIGAGLSSYHGIMGLIHPQPVESLFWALAILGGSLVSEGATLVMAVSEIRHKAKLTGCSFWNYVRGGYDPSVNVILLEDLAAVTGVVIAGSCMFISSYLGNGTADAIGSLVIGGLLGVVSAFIIQSNSHALVGRSIPEGTMEDLTSLLESDRMIRSLQDVKATDMGADIVRFKAEVDIDGKELTRLYLEKIDLQSLLKEMNSLQSIEEVEALMLMHGENIVDLLGGEIDRIEKKLKKKYPNIRHVDLEVL